EAPTSKSVRFKWREHVTYCRFLMQILTQRGGYITVHSVRSNEASFYIVDYGESNGESYDKNN
ncbi:hypothetical protein DWV90_08340, partial [Ruminococcus sp. AF13-37]